MFFLQIVCITKSYKINANVDKISLFQLRSALFFINTPKGGREGGREGGEGGREGGEGGRERGRGREGELFAVDSGDNRWNLLIVLLVG